MSKYICIHSHFYQPPRENPWLDYVEQEDSAYPFHDWNVRITKECYGPNALSRILDREGFVTELVNNYTQISFNFGPTLMTWMEMESPEVYQAILDADQESIAAFNGHGNAMAQVYNHIILPLANKRDKETQIIWGIYDFQSRFKHYPEGMWLAETAVDIETLEIMAQHGIKFVVLAPRQAKAVRDLHGDTDEDWQDVSDERIDTRRPYVAKLPSGASIACFFYDGHISRTVAFEGLLHDGEKFAQCLLGSFDSNSQAPQLVHIATDGETYGHHHRHGEMALSYALHIISQQPDVKLTNYGQFLSLYPPTMEVAIHENSSWSCVHGVERWRSDCGCSSGMQAGFNQKWRSGLREAFDYLRDALSQPFAQKLQDLGIEDAWGCRNDYITCISNRDQEHVDAFLKQWRFEPQSRDQSDKVGLFQALEMQRYLLYMYTSCGWFFDEVSGLESIQNLKYAHRALFLGQKLFKIDLETNFRNLLRNTPSNDARFGDAERVFDANVAATPVDLYSVGMHVAISSLFHSYDAYEDIYCYSVQIQKFQRFEAGRVRMVVGKMNVQHKYTFAQDGFAFAVLHLGDHNINGGIRRESKDVNYEVINAALNKKFNKGEIANLIRTLDKTFSGHLFTLKDLFKDDQRRIVKQILQTSLNDVEAGFKQIYNNNYPLMCYLSELTQPLPKVFLSVAQFYQNAVIESELEGDRPDLMRLKTVIADAARWGTSLDLDGFAHKLSALSEQYMDQVESSENSELMNRIAFLKDLVEFAISAPLHADLWHLQNRFFLWMDNNRKKDADYDNRLWEQVTYVAQCLKLRVPS